MARVVCEAPGTSLSPQAVETIRYELTALASKGVPPPSATSLANLRGMRLSHEQCQEVFSKYVKWYKHQASPAEQLTASKRFSFFCTVAKKQAGPGPPVPRQQKITAANQPGQGTVTPLFNHEVLTLLNELAALQPEVQLDESAMTCLKAACMIDPSHGVRALKMLLDQEPKSLMNPSAWFVGLMRKREWGFFTPKRVCAFEQNVLPSHQLNSGAVSVAARTQDNPEGLASLARKPQGIKQQNSSCFKVPTLQEELSPSTPVARPSYRNLPIIETVSRRFDLTRDKQYQKLMQDFNASLFAHDCTVEVMGCSHERLAKWSQQASLDLPAEDLPEYCTRPYGHVLLLMVNEQDGSLHGPWAAMPGTQSPDQIFNGAVQQVSFRRTAIHIRLPQATTFCIIDYDEKGWYLPQSLKLKGKKAFIKALTASKG